MSVNKNSYANTKNPIETSSSPFTKITSSSATTLLGRNVFCRFQQHIKELKNLTAVLVWSLLLLLLSAAPHNCWENNSWTILFCIWPMSWISHNLLAINVHKYNYSILSHRVKKKIGWFTSSPLIFSFHTSQARVWLGSSIWDNLSLKLNPPLCTYIAFALVVKKCTYIVHIVPSIHYTHIQIIIDLLELGKSFYRKLLLVYSSGCSSRYPLQQFILVTRSERRSLISSLFFTK